MLPTHVASCSRVAPYAVGSRSSVGSRNRAAAQLKGCRKLTVCKAATLTDEKTVSWLSLETAAGQDVLDGYVLRSQSKPSTAPNSVLPTEEHVTTEKDVILYRDTNAWCPFCERVWLALEEKGVAYDTVFINLRDKPEWYKGIVPTNMVPAIKLKGEVVYESYDILKKLEAEYPDTPLLPADDARRDEAEEIMTRCQDFSSAGYGLLTSRVDGVFDASKIPEFRVKFEEQLQLLEGTIAKHGGPYIMGKEFGMVDIMYMPTLERMGANLPTMRGFELRNNHAYPAVGAWFAAMDTRPAYKKVKSDDDTLQLLMKRFFKVTPSASTPEEGTMVARREAAAKIVKNRNVIIQDIFKNSGIYRYKGNPYGATVMAMNGWPAAPSAQMCSAVELALRRLCNYLLTGDTGPRHDDVEGAAIASAALTFFRSRASAPRDLSADAARELRLGCLEVLKDMY